MSVTYIYALKDPRDGSVRYVGRTCNPKERERCHTKGVSQPKTRMELWVCEMVKLGVEPLFCILETTSHTRLGNEAERRWARHYQAQGCHLLNDLLLEKLETVNRIAAVLGCTALNLLEEVEVGEPAGAKR